MGLLILKGTVYILLFLFSETGEAGKVDWFKDTEVWQLAKYVRMQDTRKIRSFVEQHPEINIDTQCPEFGTNLLQWCIDHGKYRSFEQLLKLGANSNYVSSKHGETPLMLASSFETIFGKEDIRYIVKLLEFGADPNLIVIVPGSGLEKNALHEALRFDFHDKYFKYLMEHGNGNPFILCDGRSLLESAILFNNYIVADYLIENFRVFDIDKLPVDKVNTAEEKNIKEKLLKSYIRTYKYLKESNQRLEIGNNKNQIDEESKYAAGTKYYFAHLKVMRAFDDFFKDKTNNCILDNCKKNQIK